MIFKPGDHVRIVRGPKNVMWKPHVAHFIGCCGTVIGEAEYAPLRAMDPPDVRPIEKAYPVQCNIGCGWFIAEVLEKIEPPPPQRQETGSWDVCPWQPHKIKELVS